MTPLSGCFYQSLSSITESLSQEFSVLNPKFPIPQHLGYIITLDSFSCDIAVSDESEPWHLAELLIGTLGLNRHMLYYTTLATGNENLRFLCE